MKLTSVQRRLVESFHDESFHDDDQFRDMTLNAGQLIDLLKQYDANMPVGTAHKWISGVEMGQGRSYVCDKYPRCGDECNDCGPFTDPQLIIIEQI